MIEVTSTLESGTLVEYYAQNEGVVATVEADEAGTVTQVWQAQAIYHENRIINNVEVMLPTTDDAMVEPGQAAISRGKRTGISQVLLIVCLKRWAF